MAREMERRDFLKAATVLGASAVGAAALAGCSGKASASGTDIKWDQNADVVVVGGGGAGYAAALEAAMAGSSVIILEKNPAVGGNTCLCGGVIMVAGSKVQDEFATKDPDRFPYYKGGDTAQAYGDQIVRWAQGFGDEAIIREMIEKSSEAVDWMISLGREYTAIEQIPPIWVFDTDADLVPRSLWRKLDFTEPSWQGPDAEINTHFTTLKKKADTLKNVSVQTSAEATHLIQDADGAVIGVEAEAASGTIRVKARKGVVLATANADNNVEMAKELGLQQQFWGMSLKKKGLSNPDCFDNATNVGDGIRMGREIGADLHLSSACVMQDVHYLGGISEYSTAAGHSPNLYRSNKIEGNIVVNVHGRRFVQEDAEWAFVVSQCAKQAIDNGWSPDDDRITIGPHIIIDADHLWQWANKGIDATKIESVVSADTLEELAAKIGVPAANLVDEVNKWNAYCAAGVDPDFGRRTDFGPIKTPPFYADTIKPGVLGCAGGLKSNADTQVISVKGEPIPRLYAAGLVSSGNWIGPFYPGCGWAILGTVVWGRKAGKNAAALKAWDAA